MSRVTGWFDAGEYNLDALEWWQVTRESRLPGLIPHLPEMSEYFRIGRIRSLDIYNRIAAMELGLQGQRANRFSVCARR